MTSRIIKRKLFIGCSFEAIHIARSLKCILKNHFKKTIEPFVYDETEWKNLSAIIDNLKNRLDEFYYAIFIGYPDDIINSRNTFYYTCRDNVLFEMGLFLSRIGKERTFFVIPKDLDYDSKTPLELSNMGLNNQIKFKLLSDFGGSIVISSRIKLKYELARRAGKNNVNKKYDKWNACNLKEDLGDLFADIEQEELKHNSLSTNNEENEIKLKAKSENIINDIASTKLASDTTEEVYINKLIDELPYLIYARSKASEKAVSDTTIDIIELIYKFKDILDVQQLSKLQHYKKVKKVWVFADSPIEFDATTNRDLKRLLRERIVDNLKHNVEYTYIVSKKFKPEKIDSLFTKLSNKEKAKLKKRLHIIQAEPKYFKTFFTLHFDDKKSLDPSSIFMSALLPQRNDLLIQISTKEHYDRIYERIKKLVGHVVPDSTYHVIDHVVDD